MSVDQRRTMTFLPSCDTSLRTLSPSTKAEPLAVAVLTFWIWLKLGLALFDESDVGA
jgi:hypothetical protein